MGKRAVVIVIAALAVGGLVGNAIWGDDSMPGAVGGEGALPPVLDAPKPWQPKWRLEDFTDGNTLGSMNAPLESRAGGSATRPQCCRGFCFNATIESVDKDDLGTVKVRMSREDGTNTLAIVHRRYVGDWRGIDFPRGKQFGFSCSEGSEYMGPVATYEDCIQSPDPLPDTLTNRPKAGRAGPAYDPHAQSWAQLPPAATARTIDNCVGYCFDAVIESVSKKHPRIARVVIFEEHGTASRAIVHRTRMDSGSRTAAREREPVRFTCFDKLKGAGTTPRFEDCVQMAAAGPKADVKCAATAQPIEEAPTLGENELDVFLPGLNLD